MKLSAAHHKRNIHVQHGVLPWVFKNMNEARKREREVNKRKRTGVLPLFFGLNLLFSCYCSGTRLVCSITDTHHQPDMITRRTWFTLLYFTWVAESRAAALIPLFVLWSGRLRAKSLVKKDTRDHQIYFLSGTTVPKNPRLNQLARDYIVKMNENTLLVLVQNQRRQVWVWESCSLNSVVTSKSSRVFDSDAPGVWKNKRTDETFKQTVKNLAFLSLFRSLYCELPSHNNTVHEQEDKIEGNVRCRSSPGVSVLMARAIKTRAHFFSSSCSPPLPVSLCNRLLDEHEVLFHIRLLLGNDGQFVYKRLMARVLPLLLPLPLN